MKELLRYNGYHKKQNGFPEDPSVDNPSEAISARFDLSSHFHNLSGGVDCKVTFIITNITFII